MRDIPLGYQVVCLLFRDEIGDVHDEWTLREYMNVEVVLWTCEVGVWIDT